MTKDWESLVALEAPVVHQPHRHNLVRHPGQPHLHFLTTGHHIRDVDLFLALEEDSIEAPEPFYDGAEEEVAGRHGDEIRSTQGPLSEEALYKCARLCLFAGAQLSNLSATFFILNSYSVYAGFFGRPLVTFDRPSRLPDKEIFEYIRAYSSIFDVF
jgi:hypothetical protein